MTLVNAYCRSDGGWGGWLFDDLKRDFEAHDQAGVTVLASDLPLPDADAWIAIRTDEALASPDPARTVVQVHDFREHLRAWRRRAEWGCISVVHKGQLGYWGHEAWDDPVDVYLRPIGARRLFTLRESMPERYTIGWVGRDVVWQGRHIKHPEAFVEAVNLARRQLPDLRATMYGPGLERYAAECGAEHVDGDRAESLRDWYHGIDLLCITCEPEPGPLSKYEANACGVHWLWVRPKDCDGRPMIPVVAQSIVDILGQRRYDFENRAALRSEVPCWQDEWVAANVNLALELCR